MLEKLSGALKKTTDKIANAVLLDANSVNSIVRELQRALIEADVNVSLVMSVTKKIKQAALDERIKGLEKKEHLIKLLHDELVRILGEKKEIVLRKRNAILLVGLYGAGKTTSIGKIGAYYSKRGHKVCAVGLDVHRPAAPEQLRQVGEKVHIPVFIDPEEKNPLTIWKKYKKEIAKFDVVLVDSAGRDALDEDLVKEIEDIGKLVNPSEVLLVMPADIGQAAKQQAESFKKAVGVSGVFITRMDSTAKGGGALTACSEAEAPVVFIGTGELPSDIETFNPESFLSRLLGMGDLTSLMEKIHSVVGEKELERQQQKLQEGKFTLRDLQGQLDSMGEMGGFDKLMGMVPGFGKVKEKVGEEQLEAQQSKVARWKHCISSMTPEEIDHPELLEKQTSRIQRVAKGSGCSTSDVRALLKQYKMLNEMIKNQSSLTEGNLDQKTIMKMARKFGKKLRF